MISVKQQLDEIARALREVIAPAIAEPYPRAQAHMAAVVLDFVARQVEEERGLGQRKVAILRGLFDDLSRLPEIVPLLDQGPLTEERLSQLIERLYAAQAALGDQAFHRAHVYVRQVLRHLLDQELKIAKVEEE